MIFVSTSNWHHRHCQHFAVTWRCIFCFSELYFCACTV